MVRTSRQLKALVRNLSGGDSTQAQILIRNFVMERFLERISLSEYRNYFILKGGMLISAMMGIDNRSTMDMDTAVKKLSLSVTTAKDILEDICAVHVDDGVSFKVRDIYEIMDEAEYSGVRAILESRLENMRTPLRIDISTGSIITPGEIFYNFKLMFEERTIPILAYNPETVMAEKLETIISRGVTNTRMRDFYDLYILQNNNLYRIDSMHLCKAFAATCRERNSVFLIPEGEYILEEVRDSVTMQKLWSNYQKKFRYAENLSWEMVMENIIRLYKKVVIAFKD